MIAIKSTSEISSMTAVISPLFLEPKILMIVAIILAILFTFLTHKKNGRIRTNRNGKDSGK